MITLTPGKVYRGLPGVPIPAYLAAYIKRHNDAVRRGIGK